MRAVNLPSFTLPSQSYAIISYPTQQPHPVQDMMTQLRSSNTAINDQPQEIDPASQLTQMKVCDSVVSLPISNTIEPGLPCIALDLHNRPLKSHLLLWRTVYPLCTNNRVLI